MYAEKSTEKSTDTYTCIMSVSQYRITHKSVGGKMCISKEVSVCFTPGLDISFTIKYLEKGNSTCFTLGEGLESVRGKMSVKKGKCKCFPLIVEHDGSFMTMQKANVHATSGIGLNIYVIPKKRIGCGIQNDNALSES